MRLARDAGCLSVERHPMAKKTYEEYLIEQNPAIAAIAADYAALGVANPLLWAKSEFEGKDPYAACLFGHALRSEIHPPDDHVWIDAAREGDMNFENATLQTQVAETMRYLEQSGIDLRRLTPLVRAVQTQVVAQIASTLDEGPELLCLPLPNGRKAHWGVFSVDEDDMPGLQIDVRAVVNDPEEL